MIDNDDSKNSVFLSFSTFIILQRIETILELLTEPQRRTVDDLMGVALTDMKGDDLAVLGITVDEGDVVEQTEVLLRVLQTFVEVEADNIVGYVVAAHLHTMNDAAYALFLRVKTEIDEGDFETCGAEVVYHPQYHVAGKVGFESKIFLLLQCFVLLFFQFGGNGAAHPAVRPVGMLTAEVEHEFIAVERCGADVERTETALACTVRTGYDGKLWTTLHYFAMR